MLFECFNAQNCLHDLLPSSASLPVKPPDTHLIVTLSLQFVKTSFVPRNRFDDAFVFLLAVAYFLDYCISLA